MGKIEENFVGQENQRPDYTTRISLLVLQIFSGAVIVGALTTVPQVAIATWTFQTLALDAFALKVMVPAVVQGIGFTILLRSQTFLLQKSNGNWTDAPLERALINKTLRVITLSSLVTAVLVAPSLIPFFSIALLFKNCMLHLYDLNCVAVPLSLKNRLIERYESWVSRQSPSLQTRIQKMEQGFAHPHTNPVKFKAVYTLFALSLHAFLRSKIPPPPPPTPEQLRIRSNLAKNPEEYKLLIKLSLNNNKLFAWLDQEGQEELVEEVFRENTEIATQNSE